MSSVFYFISYRDNQNLENLVTDNQESTVMYCFLTIKEGMGKWRGHGVLENTYMLFETLNNA